MEYKEPRSIWGKLAVITALLGSIAGVGTALTQCSGASAPITINTPQLPPYNSTPYTPPQPAAPPPAFACCDAIGIQRCPLLYPAPRGSGCFCPNQGTGFSC